MKCAISAGGTFPIGVRTQSGIRIERTRVVMKSRFWSNALIVDEMTPFDISDFAIIEHNMREAMVMAKVRP